MTEPVSSKDLCSQLRALPAGYRLLGYTAAEEIERLSRPAHEREPPHCATCSCGMTAPEPNAVVDPDEFCDAGCVLLGEHENCLREERVCRCIPLMPRSWNYCQDCGGAIKKCECTRPKLYIDSTVCEQCGNAVGAAQPPRDGQ